MALMGLFRVFTAIGAVFRARSFIAPFKPESTDRGRQVSDLKWSKGAPLNLG